MHAAVCGVPLNQHIQNSTRSTFPTWKQLFQEGNTPISLYNNHDDEDDDCYDCVDDDDGDDDDDDDDGDDTDGNLGDDSNKNNDNTYVAAVRSY